MNLLTRASLLALAKFIYYYYYYYYYYYFISHTTSCISGYVSLGHHAISYSLRFLTDQGRGR